MIASLITQKWQLLHSRVLLDSVLLKSPLQYKNTLHRRTFNNGFTLIYSHIASCTGLLIKFVSFAYSNIRQMHRCHQFHAIKPYICGQTAGAASESADANENDILPNLFGLLRGRAFHRSLLHPIVPYTLLAGTAATSYDQSLLSYTGYGTMCKNDAASQVRWGRLACQNIWYTDWYEIKYECCCERI